MSANMLPWIVGGLQAGSVLMGGNSAAAGLRLQGHIASQQALADEASKRRENRQLRGQNAAALAENGLTSTGSSAGIVAQDAALAELDALNIRYAGQMRRTGLLAEAQETKAGSRMLAGQALLQTAGRNYRSNARVGGVV